MKILFDSYSTVTQNEYGGVSVRMKKTAKHLQQLVKLKFFDKWNDKITDYDILHTFKVSFDNYSAVCHAKSKGVKVVVSSVIDPTYNMKLRLNKLAANFLLQHNSVAMTKKTFDMADAIMCQTEKERKFVEKVYSIDKTKLFVVPSAIDGKREDASADYFRKKTGIEGKFVLQVGRFDPNKNQMSTIKAVNETDMQLVLIGGADKQYADYYDKCKVIAGNNVHFLGWVDHNDPLLASAYDAAHTFIIPSHKEIFGNTLFESGIYGCNVVATKALPISSWGMEECCLTVNPKSIDDIRAKLEESLNRERTGEFAKIVERDFSWDGVIKQYMDIYNYVLKEN